MTLRRGSRVLTTKLDLVFVWRGVPNSTLIVPLSLYSVIGTVYMSSSPVVDALRSYADATTASVIQI